MGNAGSGGSRDRQKSDPPHSPSKEDQAFVFDKKPNKLVFQSSHEEEEPYFAKGQESSPSNGSGDRQHEEQKFYHKKTESEHTQN